MDNSKNTNIIPASMLSAFGTLETAELTPVFQSDFVYGLNVRSWSSPVVSGVGASVDTNEGRLRIQSGTDPDGYAYLPSRRPVRYRAGQGTLVRFTPLFSPPRSGSTQLLGMGTISGGAPYDGYFLGYDGLDFGVAHYARGVANWQHEDGEWYGERLPFAWNKTYGIPIMIKYPYLGYGDIFFFVQDPATGRWIPFHTICYANTSIVTQLSNPTLKFVGRVANNGNTDNLTMRCGSVGAFVSGARSFVGSPKWAWDGSKSNITAETNILSIKNASMYNGLANTGLLRLTSISVSSSANAGVATFRVRTGAAVGGIPTFTPINGSTSNSGSTITAGNSVASWDTAGTTVTGGFLEFSISIDNPGSLYVDLVPHDLFVSPGDIATLSGFSSNSSSMGVSLSWAEDI